MKQSHLIDAFLDPISSFDHPALLTAPGDDDCAILRFGDELLVMSTDRINSSPLAFELGIEDYPSLGRYLVSANLSDILSSGARPLGLFTNISVPDDFDLDALRRVAVGVDDYLDRYDCVLLGGDTKEDDSFVLSGIGLGTVPEEALVRSRTGAEPGDYVVVSGQIGSCYAAAVASVELEPAQYSETFVTNAITDPGLPYEANEELRSRRLGKGGIDVSDGFGGDLETLARHSDVGLDVVAESVPLADEVRHIAGKLDRDPIEFAFGFGGDWEFVATIDESRADDIPEAVTVVGRVTDDDTCTLVRDGGREPLPSFAYDDFEHDSFFSEIR